ncbi:TetR/AcrR family transcriptional regulator [Pseudonocardia sp. MH-G8]|uniref:TetR/AcrR family transcriptional regulator n=1 Tax=Pseudonocardia sp. MH-G8 TaxID=1854588 RepID=UPI000B9FFA1A|nr:TetR/AcrR family transcriptional regulator [Pseudonocardia sp. MH-G8]OZM79414.1 TetR family transcriptional regulator [Pseudonocardia sp. MH-G8]
MAQQGGTRRGRPPLGEQGRRRQRLEISREAVRLFRAHGVAGTSGVRIAEAAGVSERTLWRLFRTKESCVEPLLTEALDGFCAVLRSWPAGVELAEHLQVAYTFVPRPSRPDIGMDADMDTDSDTDAVLAVVRMTRDDPALRAVWLVLQERAEPTLAEVLAPRAGLPPGASEVRVLAATVNAALRVVTDDFAHTAADGVTSHDVEGHRQRLAETLRAATRVLAPGGA